MTRYDPFRCVNCGDECDKDAVGIIDSQGRFWCEDCCIHVLGDRPARNESKAKREL